MENVIHISFLLLNENLEIKYFAEALWNQLNLKPKIVESIKSIFEGYIDYIRGIVNIPVIYTLVIMTSDRVQYIKCILIVPLHIDSKAKLKRDQFWFCPVLGQPYQTRSEMC